MAIDPKELNTDGLIFETEDDATAPLRATMEQSIKQNPEQSAKIFDISQKAKTDTELVRSNPEDFERAQALKGLNLDGLVLSSPGTAKYLEDVDNASVSHDDVPVLKRLETAIKNAFSYTPLGLSVQAGQATGEFARDTYEDGKLFEGLGTTIPNSFKDVGAGFEQLRMNTRERELANQKAIADNTPPWLKYIAGEEVDDANREAVTERVSVEQEALIKQFSESLNAVRTRAIENKKVTPENLTVAQEGVRAGITSGSHMAAALTAAALTRSGRAGVLTLMGGSSYGSSYAEAMQKGLSDDDAHMYSLIQASIEVGTEMLPTKTLLALASTPAGGKMFKGVVKFMVQEGLTEQIATLGQTLTDYGYGLDKELAKAKSAEEALEIQARRQAVTAIATVVGGGGQIGVVKAASKLGERLMTEEQRNQRKQEYEQAQLDEIAKVAAESKTKKRSPAMMKRFMQSATDTESNEIHIDAVQARLYISSLDADVIAADPALQLLAERIQANDAPNGDITIPLGDFAADIVGNEHYEALRPHMKLSGETDTPFRREAEGQQRVEYAKNLMMQAEQNASAYVENRQMFESVKQQLIDTEVVSPKLADYYAQLIPAYVTVKADELGKSPLEVYEELGLRIEGPYAERKAALAEGRVLEQESELTDTPEFKAWAGTEDPVIEGYDINETDFREEKPYVLRAFHGTTHDFDTFDASVKGNKEGQFGAINYFTSSEYDAEQNYLSDGPDITNRIEQLAERWLNDNDLEYTDENIQEAREKVASSIGGDNEHVKELYIRTNKPFVVGGDNNPFIELSNYEDAEASAISEVAELNDVTEDEVRENYDEYEDQLQEYRDEYFFQNEDPLTAALDKVAFNYDLDAGQLKEEFYDIIADGVDHTTLEERLRSNEGISYAEDSETGELIGSQVLADIIKELGFDSIILKGADQRFKSMDMEQGTTHIHVFDENNTQIKSATDNSGAFNPNDPNILRQDGFLADDTRVNNFKKWFGNSAVTDENGSPKVVYHGTTADFDTFQKAKAGVNTQADNAGEGFFFTDQPGIAGIYPKMQDGQGDNIMPTYLSIQKPLTLNVSNMTEADQMITEHFNDNFDGVIINVVSGNQTVYMVRDANQIKSAVGNNGNFNPNNANILEQTRARGHYDVSNVTIRLTEASDASTFLHEFAHFMLDMERKTGGRQMGNISLWWSKNREEIAREASLEVEVVDRWIEDETTVEPVQAEALDRATHEQFARGFETYIMEGKAPSIELRNAFRVFARLIRQVYNAIRNGLNSPNLDAEMRQVFDRLLATEEQIVAEEARSRYEPLFTDAAMAGMTDEAYESYIERSENARDKARETLRDKLLRELTRNTKAWWKQELEDRKEDKLVELANEPVYAAREAIANDDAFKIDRVAAKELLGVDKIPPTLRGMTITGKRGGMPDDVAATLGYNSGQELLDALMTAPPINQAAQEAAEAEMLKVHGDIMNDGSLEQMAQDAARNEERADLILEEVKQLSRATTTPQIDKQTLKFLAAQQIGKRSLTQIRPDKYRRAEIRSAQEATEAMQNNNKEAALRAKTQQVMNMYLWQSAMAAREQGERVTKHMARFRKKSVRERIGKAGNGYLEAIMGILDRFEFRKSISIRKAQENAQSIQAWLTERMQDGDNIVLTAEVVDERYGMHWKQLPIDELTGIYESVLSIEHNAKTANEIMLAEEKVTFEQSIQRALASMAKVKNKYSAQRTDIIDEKNPVRRFIAEQTKIPFLTTWLDGGERAGVVNDLIMTPINNAQHQEQELWATVGRSVVDALQNRSKEMRKRHAKKIHIPELVSEPTEMHTGHDGNLYGHQIIAVALNTGNESNLRKMLVGEGWATEENVSFNNPQLQAALSHMTKEDWDLVQDIWTNIDVLYPMLADVHERTSGLALPKVEATPVQTPFGEYSGGYYPAKYDPNRSQRAADNEEKANEQTLSMFNGAGLLLPTVSTGARQERTGYTGPIKLSLEVVQEHMHEVIHFVTHYEAVKQVDKFIRDPRIAEAVKAKMGKEEYNLLRPWLNDVAKDGRGSESKLQMESWLGKLRVGVTLGTMGFKASTILIQGSGIFNTMAETGTVNVLRAMRSIMASDKTMGEAYNHAFEHSKVLKYRMQTMDRELRNVLSSVEGKNSMWAKTQQTSMMGIALFQTYTVDVASWYAGYIKGMKDFEGDQLRAYKYADWVVENAQGSGNTKDMAAIMRNKNEGWRLFTMFMTFFSSLGNMTRDTVRGARSGQYSIGSVGAKAILMFLMPALYETLMRDGVPDDDDELEDFVERVTFNAVMMPVGSQPVIRDAANGLGSGFGYNSSPVTATIGKGVQASASMTKKLAEDDEVTVPQIKNFSKLIAAWYGVPGTNQMWATGEHIGEVLNDGEDFSTRELLFGPDRE